MSKIVMLGDLHCGHAAGLTPPDWWVNDKQNLAAYQRESWARYLDFIKQIGRPDILICNGDAIDGKGQKSQGVELLTPDMEQQALIAAQCLGQWKAKKVIMTYGTPYHTGTGENFENIAARALDADIANQQFLEIDGVIFSIKHKPAGSSSIPHGRHTGVARDRLWNVLHADIENQPKADVIIRSHVHYHTFSGGPDWLAMTLPALQGPKSRYGVRECTGIVDWGIITFQTKKGAYSWQSHIVRMAAAKAKLKKL